MQPGRRLSSPVAAHHKITCSSVAGSKAPDSILFALNITATNNLTNTVFPSMFHAEISGRKRAGKLW